MPVQVTSIEQANKIINDMIKRYDEDYRLLRNYVENGLAHVIQQDPNDSTRLGEFDNVHKVPVSIGIEHHEMHEGDFYFIKTFLVDTEGTGNTTYFAFSTPNSGKRVHARAKLAPDVDTEVNIYEDATITGGVAVPGMNCDRESANTPTLVAVAGPVIDTPGNKIWAARNGGGRNPVGVAPGLNYEIIAKQNSVYVFEIIKRTTADLVVDIDFFWYEHTTE
jgi:hypothetical protein